MRKAILIILMIPMFASPCFAQEIEVQGFFTLNNTLWLKTCEPWVEKCIPSGYVGFSQNSIYYEGLKSSKSLIINLGLVSFYWATFPIVADLSFQISGFASPLIGIGFHKMEESSHIDMIRKIANHWIPKPKIYIVPYEGTQEEQLHIKIMISHVILKENDLLDLSFDPPDGLSASNIKITGYREIEFDLDIATETPLGFKSLSVIWDDGKKLATEADVFEVVSEN